MIKVGDFWFPDDELHVTSSTRRLFEEGYRKDRWSHALGHVQKWSAAALGKSAAVEVGSHVGSWLQFMAPYFRRVVGFEAHPDTAACLRLNVAGIANVTVVDAAIGDGSGGYGFTQRKGSVSNALVAGTGSVPTVRLDDVLPALLGSDRMAFLKLHCNGAEGLAIRGAHAVIDAHRPVVMVVVKNNYTYPVDPVAELEGLRYVRCATLKPDLIFRPRERA